MQLDKHTLVNDFPEHQHTIRHLKMNDNHFAKLFAEYHELESEVHHIEKNNEAVADDYLDSLKKRRVHLKDQLYNLVVKTEKSL
ncbi:MAG: YdcH family protein [Paraglaciecola sp.]|nr:YdcH family protein [Paraglaciecola sp.]